MYKYGASFNCQVRPKVGHREDVGGGGEGDTTLDYVGNDIDRMFAAMQSGDASITYALRMEHELVGGSPDVGSGVVIAVMVEDTGEIEDDKPYEPVVAVFFEGPSLPTIVD